MSYNCDSIEIIENIFFRIKTEIYLQLQKDLENKCPEFHIFNDDWVSCQEMQTQKEYIYVNDFTWCGEFSGTSWDTLIKIVLPKFEGRADMICIWEGRQSVNGLRADNGRVSKHEVIQKLDKEI